MVSAYNLNFDILETIFAYLPRNDLASIALVNRCFLAGVTPNLYRTISYNLRHSKKYLAGSVISPFNVIVSHPGLAVHVRDIAIRAVPVNPSSKTPHPEFIIECTKAIFLCRNLTSFRCTVPNILHYFLIPMQEKKNLESLRVHANLTTDQAKMLLNLNTVQSLALEFASWIVVDTLPKWLGTIGHRLIDLTLYMTMELNETILQSILKGLPQLLGLHVIGCAKIDHVTVLQLLSYTPQLESLSFTTTEVAKALIPDELNPFTPSGPPLYNLRNLSLDTRFSPSTSPTILSSILTHFKSSCARISSFCIKIPDGKVTIGPLFIKQLLSDHGQTLRRVAFFACGAESESIAEICKQCAHLECLEFSFVMKEFSSFAEALSHSKTLCNVVDVNGHVTHGPRQTLTRSNALHMMSRVPSLKEIVSDSKTWSRCRGQDGSLSVVLERQPGQFSGAPWYWPQESRNNS